MNKLKASAWIGSGLLLVYVVSTVVDMVVPALEPLLTAVCGVVAYEIVAEKVWGIGGDT